MSGSRRAGKLVWTQLTGLLLAAALTPGGIRGEVVMEQNPKETLKAAAGAYAAGRFAAAEERLDALAARQRLDGETLKALGDYALWRNEPGRAAEFYRRALKQAPLPLRIWPFSADLRYRLALAHWRQDDAAEAVTALEKAAGPIPVGPFSELASLGRFMALFRGDRPYRITGPEQSRLPMLAVDPLPVVVASVNGGEPVAFFIDTGGTDIMLEARYARSIGATLVGSIRGDSAGGSGKTELGGVREVVLGDFRVENVPCFTLPAGVFEALDDPARAVRLRGVIGTRLLMHFHATIDYVEGNLVLRRRSARGDAEVGRIAAGPEATSIPFRLVDMHQIVAPGSFNDQGPMLFFVDTGLGGKAFTAPEADLRRAGVRIDWGQAAEGRGGFAGSQVTDVVIERLSLGDAEAAPGAGRVEARELAGVAMKRPPEILARPTGPPLRGLISHLFFRPYAVTLDFSGMRMILERKGKR